MPPPRLPPSLFIFLTLFHVSASISVPIAKNFKCLPNGCCDQHEWCRFWASIGECQANVDWMAGNCQLACNTCPHSTSTTFFTPGGTTFTSTTNQQQTTFTSTGTRGPTTFTSTSVTNNGPSTFTTTTNGASSSSFTTTQFTQFTPPPSGPIAAVGDCRNVNQANAVEVMVKSRLVNPVENTNGRPTISLQEVTDAVATGCVPMLQTAGNCDANLCFHLMYRSYDGTCNNLQKPLQGAAFRPYIRHFPPEYDDGKGEPAASIKKNRPTAREANRIMLSSAQSVVHDKFNGSLICLLIYCLGLVMQWGQFMSHDVAKTTLQPTKICPDCNPIPSKCIPVPISPSDPNMAFQQKQCLKVTRSAPICQITPREQLNENTAYVDASMIYGSSPKDIDKFRDGRTGFLKMDEFNRQNVLPFDHSKCPNLPDCKALFTAGDIRANLFIGLSSFHILFAREHNRIARSLQMMNPQWSGDRVFQEARKIVGAEVQAVLFKEWLPKVLGVSMEKVIGPYKGYQPNVDATISNEFTTSAFRFGHGMLQENYQRLDARGANISSGGFTFGDGVFKTGKILFEGGIDPIIRGFMMSPVKRPHRMTPAITEKMFGSTDLGSLNIQRGRDHGIPSYNKLRQFCGMPVATDFEGFGGQILDRNLRSGLERNYQHPDNVDFYVGAMLEDPVVGGLVGSSLACLIGEQFKRLRDGDRFYFENPGIFTPAQVTELHKTKLSRIICDNADNFELISEDAFLLPGSRLTPCTLLPKIDLNQWKEQ